MVSSGPDYFLSYDIGSYGAVPISGNCLSPYLPLPWMNLQSVVLDMCNLGFSTRKLTEQEDALKGQIVGFFCLLEDWLAVAVKHGGQNLDKVENAKLLKQANHWLSVQDKEITHEPD